MELLVLNTDFETVAIADNYESCIWTDRYNKCGDFEVYTYASEDLFNTYQQDWYLYNRDSEHLMIIESVEIVSEFDTGNHLRVEGRSLESILDRRIIWNQTTFENKNLQDAIEQLLNESIISPAIADRKIDNFIFERTNDERITKLKITAQYTGDTLYDVITNMCETNKIGFKIVLTNDFKFKFSLYIGEDRSYAQTLNPYVVFSPKYENIINSNYLESTATLKNITLVAGEGEGSARRTTTYGGGNGLTRREYYTDARDMRREDFSSDAAYIEGMQNRGKEKLNENKTTKTFEGEVETTIMFKYGIDYFMGDIVQLLNEYNIEHTVRVIEMVFSHNTSEAKTYPTFEVIDDEEKSA